MEQVAMDSSIDVLPSKYDLSKGEGDLQRYFIYKTVEKDGVKKTVGECRNCQEECPRPTGSTTCKTRHLEKCNKKAWAVYKEASASRKSLSTPNTPQSGRKSLQPAIDSLFKVMILFERLIYL
jgi:hypothetical protein